MHAAAAAASSAPRFARPRGRREADSKFELGRSSIRDPSYSAKAEYPVFGIRPEFLSHLPGYWMPACAGMAVIVGRIHQKTNFRLDTESNGFTVAAPSRAYHMPEMRIPVGPRITTNSTGRKNSTIGTVSIGGSCAAFFSASVMRASRFSCAMIRSVAPSGVP